MIDRLPEKALPKWLADVDVGNQSSPFPLMDVLNDSLYYPSSRFDGSPIRHLSGNIHSFIYADYGVTSDELEEEVKTPGFLGYHKILSRSVTEKELTPNGWQPPPPTPTSQQGTPALYVLLIAKSGTGQFLH